MKTFFDIRFEFDHDSIHDSIDRQLALGVPGYICVADDEILLNTKKNSKYRSAVNNGMFSICDSLYVSKSFKFVHRTECHTYNGSHFFLDILSGRKYRMMLIGKAGMELKGLKREMMKYNPDIKGMNFVELPSGEIDYKAIARMINADGADIIWIALDTPEQEMVMAGIKPLLKRGVMIGIGAAIQQINQAIDAAGNEVSVVSPTRQVIRHLYMMASLPGMLLKECFNTLVGSKSPEIEERYAFQSI